MITKGEPTNHRLRPGGTEYGRYLWVCDQIAPGSQVLDVGCNCGQLAENLTRDLGCKIVGVDIMPEFITHCRKEKLAFGYFIQGDFSRLGWGVLSMLGIGQYDVITALEVIEHPMSVRGFHLHARLLLKPGGKLVITTPHPDGIMGYDVMRREPLHVRMWTRWRLEQVFGPAVEYADIRRDECGGLLSIGAVFIYQPGGYS